MNRTDPSRPFLPLHIAVLTVSDTRSLADDRSGDILAERLTSDGHRLVARAIVRDDVPQIRTQLMAWIQDPGVDVVVSTGGTGLTGRDTTPEAFKQVGLGRDPALAARQPNAPLQLRRAHPAPPRA